MLLSGAALVRLRAIVPQGLEAQIDLAISDEYPMAQAFVVISAVQSKTAEQAWLNAQS
jgi:holo-[acyl-carrier protein] synthase